MQLPILHAIIQKEQNEKNDLIEVHYKGMKVTLKFDAPIEKITTRKDSLQKHFSYLSITNLYNEIPATSWHVYPKTPSSSLRGKGIEFTKGGESISIEIQWSIFAVTGYRDTKKCNQERAIADGSVSENCYVNVRKKLPLKLSFTNLSLKKE